MRQPLLVPYLAFLLLSTCFSSAVVHANTEEEHQPTLDEPFQSSFESLPHVPCVTLFHRNGRIGCGTVDRDVQSGQIVDWTNVVENSDDGSGISGSVKGMPSYVAVMAEEDYIVDNVALLLDFAKQVGGGTGGLLSGILVLNSTSDSSSDDIYKYSPDSTTPQGDNTPSSSLSIGTSYIWNPYGDNNIYQDYYGVPTAYVTDSSVSSYLSEVATSQGNALSKQLLKGKINTEELNPAIIAEFNYYMGPDDMDSKRCLEWIDTDDVWRPKCLPLGGNSVWAHAGSPPPVSSNDDNDNTKKEVVLIGTSIDSTSMFHDASPGANSAASNILSLLLAAKLLGSTVNDATLDTFPKQIVFGFFQGESYGYLGSRMFFRDLEYPGFQCESDVVPSVAKKNGEYDSKACLNPLRDNLDFMNLGSVAGMIALDQVGVLTTDKTLYVHHDGNEDGNFDGILSQVLQSLSSDDWTVSASSVQQDDDDDGEYPYPPTPLTSLIKLSGGNVGGAVLAGYDDAYADGSLYHSHLDSNSTSGRSMDMVAIAASATVLARAAIASAYYDADNGMDVDTAVAYALNLIPNALTSNDETLQTLANCLFVDGNCDTFLNHGKMEEINTREATGLDLGVGVPLGTPPNYYVSVYNANNGQPFVRVGADTYGAYDGDEYGKKESDTFAIRPSLLEMGLHGLLNDFLGRGGSSSSSSSNSENGDNQLMNDDDLKSCDGTDDCNSISYCGATPDDKAVCTGAKKCVCSRAHYHVAVDESIVPASGNSTGFNLLSSDDDEGVSAMYTEPYWSASVTVRVYRDGGEEAGLYALGFGFVVLVVWIGMTVMLKRKLTKEKLY